MAKSAQGFLAEDGNFFINEAEADLHNAEMEIRAWCVTHTPTPIDADRVIEIIEALADPIGAYLDAKDRQEEDNHEKTVTSAVNRLSPSAEIEEDTFDERPREEEIIAILKQPIDGHEPVPYVGDSSLTEGLRRQREIDGS